MNSKFLFIFLSYSVSPVLGLIYYLKSNSYKVKRLAILIFSLIFGLTMTFSDSADGIRHLGHVETHYSEMSFYTFLQEALAILMLSPTHWFQDDLYIHVVSYLVGGLFHSPSLFFPLVALVYGYFYSGSIINLLKIFNNSNTKWTFVSLAFFTFFIGFKSLEGINTVRTWTGLWMILFGFTSFLLTNKKSYLLLVFASPLIHIGYALIALPLVIYVLLGDRPRLYTAIFLASFLLKPSFQQIKFLGVGEIGETKLEGYYDENNRTTTKIKQHYGQHTFYVKYVKLSLHDWFVSFFCVFIIFKRVYSKDFLIFERKFFSAGILILSLSHFLSFISAISNRSVILGLIFLMACFTLYFGRLAKERRLNGSIKNVATILLVSLSPFVLFRISDIFYFTSAYLLYLPTIPVIDEASNLSMQELLRLIL